MHVITICGSMDFTEYMNGLKRKLELMGYIVLMPATDEHDENQNSTCRSNDSAIEKRCFVDEHLRKIRAADAILIANFNKKGIQGYVGANTLIEIAFAYAFRKPILVLHPLGEQPCRLEVLGLQSANLNGEVANVDLVLSA